MNSSAKQPALDTSRNWGFIEPQLQKQLANSTIAVAGLGGVGGRIAVELTRLGVGGLTLADPDIFTASNLNRQEGSSIRTLEKNKAEAIAQMCLDINPGLIVRVYSEGVNSVNLEDFLGGADALVEATDYSAPHIGVMLARGARANNIPLITGAEIGFGATVTWFKPDGYTYEKYLGMRNDITVEELEGGSVKVEIGRWIPHVPSYGDLIALREVAEGKKAAPAISPAVGLCSAMVSAQLIGIISGKPLMPSAPAVLSVDVKEMRSRLIRFPYLHHRITLFSLVLRHYLHL